MFATSKLTKIGFAKCSSDRRDLVTLVQPSAGGTTGRWVAGYLVHKHNTYSVTYVHDMIYVGT